LRNVLEQATLMTDDLQLTVAHFKGAGMGAGQVFVPAAAASAAVPVHVAHAAVSDAASPLPSIKPLPQAIAELEIQAIRDALAATGGNKLAASRLLGISRATLYEKLPLLERPGAA